MGSLVACTMVYLARCRTRVAPQVAGEQQVGQELREERVVACTWVSSSVSLARCRTRAAPQVAQEQQVR